MTEEEPILRKYQTKKGILSILSGISLAVIYMGVLYNQINQIEFLFFTGKDTFYRRLTVIYATLASSALAVILPPILLKITQNFSIRYFITRILLVLLVWILGFATFYSYSASRLFLNSDFSFLYTLRLIFSPVTGIIMVFILLEWWRYQIEPNNFQTDDLRLFLGQVFLILIRHFVKFIIAALMTIPLVAIFELILPDYGEGSIGPNLVSGGFFACYLLSRFDRFRYFENVDQQTSVSFLWNHPDRLRKVIAIVVDLSLALIVIIPAFVLMGIYISDSPLLTPFENSFIGSSILFLLPVAFWSVFRFDLK